MNFKAFLPNTFVRRKISVKAYLLIHKSESTTVSSHTSLDKSKEILVNHSFYCHSKFSLEVYVCVWNREVLLTQFNFEKLDEITTPGLSNSICYRAETT